MWYTLQVYMSLKLNFILWKYMILSYLLNILKIKCEAMWKTILAHPIPPLRKPTTQNVWTEKPQYRGISHHITQMCGASFGCFCKHPRFGCLHAHHRFTFCQSLFMQDARHCSSTELIWIFKIIFLNELPHKFKFQV